jgi:hypothetical protein
MRQALGSAAPLGSFRMSTCGSTRRISIKLPAAPFTLHYKDIHRLLIPWRERAIQQLHFHSSQTAACDNLLHLSSVNSLTPISTLTLLHRDLSEILRSIFKPPSNPIRILHTPIRSSLYSYPSSNIDRLLCNLGRVHFLRVDIFPLSSRVLAPCQSCYHPCCLTNAFD